MKFSSLSLLFLSAVAGDLFTVQAAHNAHGEITTNTSSSKPTMMTRQLRSPKLRRTKGDKKTHYYHDHKLQGKGNRRLKGERDSFTFANIACDDLPININSDVTFDIPSLNFSNCSSISTIFNVTNNPTINCNDMELIGTSDSSIAFEVFGGAEFKNCKLEDHQTAIIRYGGYDDGDELKIKDSIITNVETGIIVNVDENLMENDDDVKVTVERSDITGCRNGITMKAHGELKVKETSIIGRYSIKSSKDGIRTENEYNTVSVEVKDCSIAGFGDDAIEIEGPADEVEINDSDLRDCSWGIYFTNIAKKIAVHGTVIEDMAEYGFDIYSNIAFIEKIELKDVTVCNAGEADVSFFKIGTVIEEIKVSGDLYCDYAVDFNYQGTGENIDITSEYCTASCAEL